MDPTQKIFFTKDGLAELQAEREELNNVKRPATVIRLAEAREQGDLSENSEYTAAKEELAFIEGRLLELDEILHNAKIITSHKSSSVDVGCKVTLHINGQKEVFTVVGEWEANPTDKKISNSSPLGKALLGKKVGETAEVEAPAGKILYKVLHIE